MSAKVTPIRQHLAEGSRRRKRGGENHLGESCPVVAIGKLGLVHYYLDAAGQLVEMEARQHNKNTIRALFAPHYDYLMEHWPKTLESGAVVDFKPDLVGGSLMAACADAGVVSLTHRVRGSGMWRGEDNDLVGHYGETLIVENQAERPGRRGDHIYPVRPSRPLPAREKQPGGEEGPGQELMRLIRCWRWRGGENDQRLMVGWIAAGFLCGALDWRPQIWVGGGRGVGKSTLIKAIGMIYGDAALSVDDPTVAYVSGKVKHDAPVLIFDEQEPDETNAQRLFEMVKLARLAASGGTRGRGSSDHSTVEFTARFMGIFSSILRPPLKAQDLSRIALIDLAKNEGGRAPLLRPDALRVLGRRLLRRMVDMWRPFLERLDTWRDALLAGGLDARAADQYGTLLAAADVAMHDEPSDSDSIEEWATALIESTAAERAEEKSEGERFLDQVMTTTAEHWRNGEKRMIGTLVAIAAKRRVMETPEGGMAMPDATLMVEAQRVLGLYGLRVVLARDEEGKPMRDPEGDLVGDLAVANSHAGLNNALPLASHWRARSGTGGAWKQALEALDGARLDDKRSYGGVPSRGVLVPLRYAIAASTLTKD